MSDRVLAVSIPVRVLGELQHWLLERVSRKSIVSIPVRVLGELQRKKFPFDMFTGFVSIPVRVLGELQQSSLSKLRQPPALSFNPCKGFR